MHRLTQYCHKVAGLLSLAVVLSLHASQTKAQDDNLVAYWMFDEGKASLIHDASEDKLHGRVMGQASA